MLCWGIAPLRWDHSQTAPLISLRWVFDANKFDIKSGEVSLRNCNVSRENCCRFVLMVNPVNPRPMFDIQTFARTARLYIMCGTDWRQQMCTTITIHKKRGHIIPPGFAVLPQSVCSPVLEPVWAGVVGWGFVCVRVAPVYLFAIFPELFFF